MSEKSKKQSNIKSLAKILSFTLAVLFMLFGLSELFRNKGSSFDSYYEQPKNSVDVIMVGSSHVYSGYIPAVMWREYGISSYNTFAWCQPIWTSYYYIKEALKTQDLDVVFLDVGTVPLGSFGADTLDIDNMNLKENTAFNTSLNRYGLLLASSDINGKNVGVGGVNDLTLYHNKWKYPEKLFTPYEFDRRGIPLRNFGALPDQMEYEVFNYSFYDDVYAPTKKAVKYLDRIVKLSEKENFRLVFILTPFTCDRKDNAVFNWIQLYADLHGIDFINFFREAGTKAGFDMHYDMADVDHVRHTGAIKLTRYLGEYLKNIGYIPKEYPNTETLDSDAAIIYSMLEEMIQDDINKQRTVIGVELYGQ